MAHCRRCGETLTGGTCAVCAYPVGGVGASDGQVLRGPQDSSRASATRTADPAAATRVIPDPYPVTELIALHDPRASAGHEGGVADMGPPPTNAPALPAYSAAPQPPPAPRPPSWNWRRFLALYSIAVLLVAAGYAYVLDRDGRFDLRAFASAPATSAAPSSTPSAAPSSSASVDPEEEAALALKAQYDAGKERFKADGHWIVQLASKWVGIDVDSKTYTAVDIEKEHQALRDKFGENVLLVQSTDFGKRYFFAKKPADEPIWVTIFDPGTFQSVDQANAWCQASFPSLSGDELRDVCYPRQAVPPYN